MEELFLQQTADGASLDEQIHNMHDQPASSWYDLAARQMDANDGELKSAFASMGLDGQREYVFQSDNPYFKQSAADDQHGEQERDADNSRLLEIGMQLFQRGMINKAIQVP